MTYLSEEDIEVIAEVFRNARGKLAQIMAEVSEETGVSIEAIKGPSKRQPIARARQIFVHIARRQGVGPTAIARFINRDHTTACHAVDAEEQRRVEWRKANA